MVKVLAVFMFVLVLFSCKDKSSTKDVNYITVGPVAGDDYPNLQAKINSCIKNKIKNLYFKAGEYQISHPLIVEDSGKFVTLNLIGNDAAHFDLEVQNPKIVCTFSSGFAIGYQLARSSLIKGLVIYGTGIGKDTRFDAYSGISIDPYYRGTTSGSSAVLIQDCRIRNFAVGIMISQNGVTLNAENVHVEKVSIDGVKVAYATCQNQSKDNSVRDLICWDNVGTVFDGATYGQQAGNIPYIDGVNAAGSVGRIFNFGPQNFATSATHIFAEEIMQIGIIIDGGVGVAIRDSHFNFRSDWYPPYHFKGSNITFDNCSIRYYDNTGYKRIIIDGVDNSFLNGFVELPLLMKNTGWEEGHRTNYYSNYKVIPGSKTRVVPHSELETYVWYDIEYVDVENGWVITADKGAKVGDYLDGGHPFNVYARVREIRGDTLFLNCITNGFTTRWTHIGLNGFK